MQRPKILIVDDRFENLVALEKLLADLPARTVRANSGNEALALTLEHDFALVLLDVQMPVMDGFEVARLLHESFKTRHLPIIFLSAVYSGDVFKVKGVESGAVDFIEKPIVPELLLGKVRLFLELHEYRKQLIDLSSHEIMVQVSDGMLIVNRDAKVLLANPAAEKLLGKESSQLVGSHFDYPLIPKKLQEISIPTASGEKFTVELNVSSMQWSGEDVYIISMRDISERKKIENYLRKSEEKHRSMFEHAPFPYQSLDENGRFISVNLAWQETLGFTAEEVVGGWYGDVLDDESRQVFADNFQSLKDSGWVHNVPFRIRHKDGHYLDILLEGRSVYTLDGHFVQTYCIFQDISARKEAEEKLKQSESRFRLFSDYTYDWEYWSDPAGAYLYTSPSCERITGYTATEFFDQPDLLVEITSPAFKEELQSHLVEAKDRKLSVHQMTFSITTKAGELCWLEHHCLPIYDDQGVYLGRRGCNRDITERKIAEELRLELEVQLRQKFKMEAVGVMAGGMAHNFNNNLSIILGNLELVNMQKTLTAEAQEFLKNAKIGVLRSRDLIQQIMAYSRSEKQKLIPIQLAPVINETLNLLRSMIPTTVSLQYNSTPESLETTVLADATRVQEALLNLCNNAVHAMDETGRLTIDLDTVALQGADMSAEYNECLPGNFVRLSIQDTGCGMTDELLTQIFDPFYTTKGVGEGTGMGLSTVQGMIKQIGGQIKVSSTCGQGTIFNLYFPTIEDTHTEEATAENTTLPRGTERILFVDDDEMLASLGEQLLTGLGYQVSIMTESTEALKMFAVNFEHFNLVITDQTMPQLSGKDLIQELKKIKPEIPTIICTGYSSKINKEEAKELGISAFLMKPLDLPELAQTP